MHTAVLDSTAGFVAAYKSCAWAQYLARKSGVRFILHPEHGKITEIGAQDGKEPTIRTADGRLHDADLIIVAGECACH